MVSFVSATNSVTFLPRAGLKTESLAAEDENDLQEYRMLRWLKQDSLP